MSRRPLPLGLALVVAGAVSLTLAGLLLFSATSRKPLRNGFERDEPPTVLGQPAARGSSGADR
jgi:hypothetical protein